MSTPVKNDSITATSSTSSSTPSQPPMQNNSPYPMQPIPQPPSSQQQQQQHLQQPIPPIPVQIMPQPVQPQQQQQQQQQQQVPPQYAGNYYQQRPAPGYYTPSSSLDFYQVGAQRGNSVLFQPTQGSPLQHQQHAPGNTTHLPLPQPPQRPLLQQQVGIPQPAPQLQLQPRPQHQASPPPPVQQPVQQPDQEQWKENRKRNHSLMQQTTRVAATYPRKRALTACDTCRLKKIKCDNVRPRCGSCIKNGNLNCHYRTDDQQKDYSSYDPASLNILSKLDVILKDLKEIKSGNSNTGTISTNSTDKPSPDDPSSMSSTFSPAPTQQQQQQQQQHPQRLTKAQGKKFTFDKCIWDMSVLSIFKWDFFKNTFNLSSKDIEDIERQLKNDYDTDNSKNIGVIRHNSLIESIKQYEILEKLVSNNFLTIMNSFFVNAYTKVPILESYEFFDILETFQILLQHLPNMSFSRLVELYIDGNTIPPEVQQVFCIDDDDNNNSQLNEKRKLTVEQYIRLIKSIPLILIISALGIISVPVQLDNLTKYKNSQEEAKSISVGCLSGDNVFNDIPADFPRQRNVIAFMLKDYAQLLCNVFSFILENNTIESVQYYLFLSQLHLQQNSIILAQRACLTASQNVMYLLEKTDLTKVSQLKLEVINRLYWTCLKLECELNVELSPFVPLSGITQVDPPSTFPKIPESPKNDELKSKFNYSDNAIRLSQYYNDRYSWYYFLTEIAVRKVDNEMFDEIYSLENNLNHLWDSQIFADKTIWSSFIEYLNRYNGIINSLTPEIRNFVLHEVNVEQIFHRLKKKYERKQLQENKTNNTATAVNADEIIDNLDDFLIDEDLIVRAQSENIMFIKTRVVVSKLLLFRPLVYLFLQDKIPFIDIVQAVISVMGDSMNINPNSNTNTNTTSGISSSTFAIDNFNFMDSPNSSIGSATGSATGSKSRSSSTTFNLINDNESNGDLEMDYFNLINAPLFYQKQFPDEDFSKLIEYDYGYDNNEQQQQQQPTTTITIKNLSLVKQRILRIFISNLISIPKLNIPKLGTHRHPGLWYYIRNLFIGNVFQYLIYKKIQQMIYKATADVELQSILKSQLEQAQKENNDSSSSSSSSSQQPKSMEEIIGLINMAIDVKGIIASLEHSVILMEYWKLEIKDCQIYQDFIKKILNDLQNQQQQQQFSTQTQ